MLTKLNAGKKSAASYCSSLFFAGVFAALGASAAEEPKIALTVEEQRVPDACKQLPQRLCGQSNTNASLTALRTAMQASPLSIDQAKAFGTKLWALSQQTGSGQTVDDRLLYWYRLSLKRDVKRGEPISAGEQTATLAAFERATRGFDDLNFTGKTDLKILVTGFDPFGLDQHLDQSNPSGVAALSMDGLIVTDGKTQAEIQSAVFPVRFADFDEGMVESVVQPLIENNSIDVLITISMGRSEFDLERFPGRRRSATAPDNLMVLTGASSTAPLVPMLAGAPIDGPEFVEFSLPVDAMTSVQKPFRVNDNREVTTLETGTFNATSLAELSAQTSVSGSGGGYLSNEISYRTVRLVRSVKSPIAVGHIHTPRINGSDPEVSGQITRQILTMIEASLSTLNRPEPEAAESGTRLQSNPKPK